MFAFFAGSYGTINDSVKNVKMRIIMHFWVSSPIALLTVLKIIYYNVFSNESDSKIFVQWGQEET